MLYHSSCLYKALPLKIDSAGLRFPYPDFRYSNKFVNQFNEASRSLIPHSWPERFLPIWEKEDSFQDFFNFRSGSGERSPMLHWTATIRHGSAPTVMWSFNKFQRLLLSAVYKYPHHLGWWRIDSLWSIEYQPNSAIFDPTVDCKSRVS